MGFLERSRSLRRKETPFARKKQEEVPTALQTKDLNADKISLRTVQSAHSNRESTWTRPQDSKDLPRPRTAGRAPAHDPYLDLPPPPSMESLTDKRRMSMTPPPRNTSTPCLTFHENHSTTGVALESPRNPKRSFTTPVGASQLSSKKPEKKTEKKPETPEPSKPETAPRKEPHLRKSKSGVWRSFFSRKQSKPPLPDFNPADVAPPPPALPKASSKEKISPKVSPKEDKPTVPVKDPKRMAERNSISVDKTRSMQKLSRAQLTKSMGDPAALPQLKLENLSALGPPPRSFARSPSAESAMSQYFDAASHTSGPSLPCTPLEMPSQPRLDINIPAVEMERYSVMFEKLLKPQASIMERRQTAVKQLELAEPSRRLAPESPALQRRATSPNLSCHTPRAAEMVGDGSQVATPVPIYRAQAPRLLRSQTAPPGALTPSQSSFHQANKAPSTAVASSACSTSNSPIWSETSQPQTPASDTETFVSFDVNDDDDDDSDDETEIMTCNAIAMQATPLYRESQWRFDTPVASAPPIPVKHAGRCSPPAYEGTPRKQQAATVDRPHPPRTSSLEDAAAKRKTMRPAPQIGIARQVSVVRRGSPAGGLTVPSPSRRQQPTIVDPTTPVPVFSKQPLKPKLVDVRNRKSTLVVLDED